MFRKVLLLILTAFFISSAISAQNRFKTDDWDRWNWDSDFDDWFDFSRPMIEFNYGFGEPKHADFISNFAKTGFAEIKLGYSSIDEEYGDYIVDVKEKYFFGSKISDRLHSNKAGSDEISTDMYRFGFGRREGYGYVFGVTALVPYYQASAAWSKLDKATGAFPKVVDPPIPFVGDGKSPDEKIMDRYLGSFRFGTLAEGGLKIEFAGIVSLNAGYETAVIFPRHKFWKHMGSLIIESGGIWALDEFVDEIMDRSPAAGPIVNFVLKNAFAYGFYLLKKEKMNWPFETEAPLTYETFKFGLTFTF